jgi:hypothetical protein
MNKQWLARRIYHRCFSVEDLFGGHRHIRRQLCSRKITLKACLVDRDAAARRQARMLSC